MMKNNFKTYILFALILIFGVFLGATLFSPASAEKEQAHQHQNDKDFTWTCSMHPQIQKTEKGDCPICGMELIPASSMETNIDPSAIIMSKTARELAQVETTVVGNEQYISNLSLTGSLAFNQNKISFVSANYNARIEKLLISEEGEKVNKGQVIAELYAPEIEILKDELKLAKLQEDQSLLNSIQQKIENFQLSITDIENLKNGRLPLKAPKSGVISSLQVQEGDFVNTNQKIVGIADLSSIWAVLDVYQNDMNKIEVGDTLALSLQNNTQLNLPISFVSATVNQASQTLQARVELPNPNLALKPGSLITAKLKKTNFQNKQSSNIMIPKSALLWTGKRSVVYQQLENENGVYFKMKLVETGSTTSDLVEIKSGLSVGDKIVTHGAFSIDSEAQLSNRLSMLNHQSNSKNEVAFDWKKQTLKTKNLKEIIEIYLTLKEALAEDDEEKSLQVVSKFQRQLNSLDFKNQNAKDEFERIILKMKASKSIEIMRVHFQKLSNALIALMEKENPLNETLYVQFCPMADDDRGAFWLSTEQEIKNPYFGSMMLKCGNVDRKIK